MNPIRVSKSPNGPPTTFNIEIRTGGQKQIRVFDPLKFEQDGTVVELQALNYENEPVHLKPELINGDWFMELNPASIPAPNDQHTHLQIKREGASKLNMAIIEDDSPSGSGVLMFGIGTDDIRIGLTTVGVVILNMPTTSGLIIHFKGGAFNFYYHPE